VIHTGHVRDKEECLDYNPEQAYLLPPGVKQVPGRDHLCFFAHEVVERLDLRRFLDVYHEEGGRLYHPSMMLKVWLYGYALGMTSSRRLEQRMRIMEGRWVRGRKKQARRGRKPNVSPVR
jgi:transposase